MPTRAGSPNVNTASSPELGHAASGSRSTRSTRGSRKAAGSGWPGTSTRCADPPHTWHRDALAACLAGHPSTVTSFVTSGALWGVCRPCVLPYVTVPMAASARSRIARVHRSDLDPLDVTRIGGIPTTRLGRTLVDLAGIWTPKALERALDTALDGELVRPGPGASQRIERAHRAASGGPERARVARRARRVDRRHPPRQPGRGEAPPTARRMAPPGARPPAQSPRSGRHRAGSTRRRVAATACRARVRQPARTTDRGGSSTTRTGGLESRPWAGRSSPSPASTSGRARSACGTA